jgi:transposase
MARGDLTNEEWGRLEPLLPAERGHRGHPYEEHRRVINGIRWRQRTGAPWRDIPERYGPWQTCYDRLVRWQKRGLWAKVLQALQGTADENGTLLWTHCTVDSSTVRAHQHAAGARRRPAERGEKGGGRACSRGARIQSRRLQHQAAPRLRRARAGADHPPDGRTAA